MSSKLKPCHYLSALALGARYLTVCYRGDWEFIESWVPEKLKTGYAIHGLPSDPKICAWKYLECKERLEEEKQSPCEEERPEETLSDRWDELVTLPNPENGVAQCALFYVQKMLPNAEWVIEHDGDLWEISSPSCQACFGYSGEIFYFQGTFYTDGIPSLIDALTQFYKSLVFYQFEAF